MEAMGMKLRGNGINPPAQSVHPAFDPAQSIKQDFQTGAQSNVDTFGKPYWYTGDPPIHYGYGTHAHPGLSIFRPPVSFNIEKIVDLFTSGVIDKDSAMKFIERELDKSVAEKDKK